MQQVYYLINEDIINWHDIDYGIMSDSDWYCQEERSLSQQTRDLKLIGNAMGSAMEKERLITMTINHQWVRGLDVKIHGSIEMKHSYTHCISG